MKTFRVYLLLSLLPLGVFAQKADSLDKKLDSLNRKTDSVGYQTNNTNPAAYNNITRISVPVYFTLLWSDYKQQFSAPFNINGKSWGRVGIFAASIAALTFVDEPVQQQAVKIKRADKWVQNLSKYVTNTGGLYEAYTLAAFGTFGIIFKKEKMKTTTLLASQAYLTSAGVGTAAKFLFGRQRPSVYNPDRVEAEPTFHGPFARPQKDIKGNKLNSSFPSGHTTAAFAAATVYAMEYKDKPWVPILSYGAASLIGASRITQNAHWTTDVLTGAMLGYLSGRQVVNNYHRYAKIQNSQQQKPKRKKLSLNLQYLDGAVLPSLSYRP